MSFTPFERKAAKAIGLTREETRENLHLLWETIVDGLARDGRVNIPGFGYFFTYRLRAWVPCHFRPTEGQHEYIAWPIRWKPSSNVKRLIAARLEAVEITDDEGKTRLVVRPREGLIR